MEKQLSFVFIIPTKYVGFIIGKSGMYRKNVMVGTSAQFNFQLIDDIPEHTVERTTSLFGPIPDIVVLLNRLLHRIDQASGGKAIADAGEVEDVSTKEDIQKWLIPQSVCGSLIGRNGEGIKAIHRFSGAWVKIAHLDEFSNKHNERLVYIRGTAPQTQVAIRYISEYFGGRPALSTDEMIVSTPDYTAVTVPNAALSFIFNGDCDSDWFPVEGKVKIGDVPVLLEPMVGESLMRLIFEGPGAPFAMDAVMNSLRVWQSLTQQGDTSLLAHKPPTFNSMSRQTTPEMQDPDSGSESKFLHARSSSMDSSEKVSTIGEPEVMADPFTSELDEASDLEDGICGIVFVLTSSSVNWFMSSNDESGKNFVSELMATTKCYIQVLPASCCRISKCVEVKKVAVIAPSKAVRKAAMEKVVRHILMYRDAAVPALPIQAVLRKFCHNKEYSSARYAGNRVKHPAMAMGPGRNNGPGNPNGGGGQGNNNHYNNGGYQGQQMSSPGQQPQFAQMPYSFGPGASSMGGMRQMQQPSMQQHMQQQQMQQMPSPGSFMSTNYGGHGVNGLGLNVNTDASPPMMDRGNRMERSPIQQQQQQQPRKQQVQPQLHMDSMQQQQQSMSGMGVGVGLNLGLGMGYGQPMAGNAGLYTSSNSYFIPAPPSHDLPVYSNSPADMNSVPSNTMHQFNLMGRKATY